MARPTRLRMLGERRVETPEVEADERSVIEAFPRVPAENPSQLDSDVLAVLRRSHDRISGEVAQATSIAGEAMNRASAVATDYETLRARTSEVEARTEAIGNATIGALQDHAKAVRATAAEKLGATATLLSRVSSFAMDRLPALLAMGSAFWLWHGVLADPQPIQLAALGLYGACVIAPAIWLSSRAR